VAGYAVARNLQQYANTDGRDLEIDAPLCFQLKCGIRPSWRRALTEAEESAGQDYPVAVTHEDNGRTTAHMDWHTFLDILALPDVRHALKR
jgi:hypothetical protein